MDNEKIHPACIGQECFSFEMCSTDPDVFKLGCSHYNEGDFDNEE